MDHEKEDAAIQRQLLAALSAGGFAVGFLIPVWMDRGFIRALFAGLLGVGVSLFVGMYVAMRYDSSIRSARSDAERKHDEEWLELQRKVSEAMVEEYRSKQTEQLKGRSEN